MKLYRDEQILAIWMSEKMGNLGMTDAHIEEEIFRLRKCVTLDDYLRISRKGSTFQLSRKGRRFIWNLSLNAIRHEQTEKRLRELGVIAS